MMPPGFYLDVPFKDYKEDPSINNSGVKMLNPPARYKYWTEVGRPTTSTFLVGSAMHCLILTPEHFKRDFGKEAAPRKGSKGCDVWNEENPTAEALSPSLWDRAHAMAESYQNTDCMTAIELLDAPGSAETTIIFDDPETGLSCKIRPDFLRDDQIVVDLKSTVDGSPQGFYWQIKKYGYCHQQAFYTKGINTAYAAEGLDLKVRDFFFITVESVEPYLVSVHKAPEDLLWQGQDQMETNLRLYKQCIDTDTWPGYPDRILLSGEIEDYMSQENAWLDAMEANE